MKQLLYLVLLILFSFISCSSSDSNKIELQVPELLNILSPDDAVIYLSTREIDSDLTPNCGTATPTTALSTGTTTTTTTTSSSSGDVSRYTIYSQLIMKQTKEVLTLKFIYDLNQFQGSIDSQQGFIFSSDLFQRTIIGKQGTVKWNSQGVGYIDSSNTGLQTLSYFDLELNLTGSYSSTASSTTTPVECYTVDGIYCTSTVSTNKCYTSDAVKCISSGTTSGDVSVSIIGKLKCNAQNVVPN